MATHVDANAQALLEAVQAGDAGTVARLVQDHPEAAGARDGAGVSALMHAAYRGRQDIVDLLVPSRTELDIFEAAAIGRADVVAARLDEDPSRAGNYSPDGFPALALAATFGHMDAVELLLARGGDVNAPSQNPMRYTALTGAVSQDRVDIVRILLKHGARADYTYGEGYTPLHEAANKGSIEVARLLLEAGANPDAAAADGRTPLSIALARHHGVVADLLRQPEHLRQIT